MSTMDMTEINGMPRHYYVPDIDTRHEEGLTCWFEWTEETSIGPSKARCRSTKADHVAAGWFPNEHEQVIEAVLVSEYPPTNPAVLLAAARWAYLNHRMPDMVKVMVWCMYVVSNNSPDVMTETTRVAAHTMYFG